jgi:hypothetical protein
MKQILISIGLIGSLTAFLAFLLAYQWFTVGSCRAADCVLMVSTTVPDLGIELLIPEVLPFHVTKDGIFRAYTSDPAPRTTSVGKVARRRRFTPKHMTVAVTTSALDELVQVSQEETSTVGQIAIRRARGTSVAVIKKVYPHHSFTYLLTVISGEKNLVISIEGPTLRGIEITPMLLARIAENVHPLRSGEQNIGQVSSDGAPSDELSM